MLPLSSQLKLKPNDALPVNTVVGKVSLAVGPGGRNPPPLPVHAVSSTARMPAAARTMDRRKNRGAPVFMVSPKLSGTRGHADGAKVTMSAISPACNGSMSTQPPGNPKHAAYTAQILKLRRTQEFQLPRCLQQPANEAGGHPRTDLTLRSSWRPPPPGPSQLSPHRPCPRYAR